MASPTPSSVQAKPGTPAVGLGLVIVVVVIAAAVIGMSFLPQPYYAIGQVVLYVGLVASIGAKLRTCLQIAKGTEYLPKVHQIVIWVVFGVLSVVVHLGNLFGTEDRDYIRLATKLSVYLALLNALELVELMLKRAPPGTSTSAASANYGGTTITPNQPLEHTEPT